MHISKRALFLQGWVLPCSHGISRRAEQALPACQVQSGLELEELGCCCREVRGKGCDQCDWRTTGDVWVQRHQQEDPSGLGLSAWPASTAAGRCSGLWDLQPGSCSKGLDSTTLVLGSGRLGGHEVKISCSKPTNVATLVAAKQQVNQRC